LSEGLFVAAIAEIVRTVSCIYEEDREARDEGVQELHM
jgi:hypothetical protein